MQQFDLFDSREEILKKEIDELDLKITEIIDIRDPLKIKLKEICTHPEKYIKAESSYFSGSYYDTNYTKYWNICTLCGKHSEISIENHGSYG